MTSILVIFRGRVSASLNTGVQDDGRVTFEDQSAPKGDALYPELLEENLHTWHAHLFGAPRPMSISVALHAPAPASNVTRLHTELILSKYNGSVVIWQHAHNQWYRMLDMFETLKANDFDYVLVTRLDIVPRRALHIPPLANSIMFPFYDESHLCDDIILVPRDCMTRFTQAIRDMSVRNGHMELSHSLKRANVQIRLWDASNKYTCCTNWYNSIENPFYTTGVAMRATTHVPKLLWMMWIGKSPELSAEVSQYIAHTKNLNPGWRLTVLTLATNAILTHDLDPPPVRYLSIEHVADWYRLQVLYKYGGVWLDAGTVSFKPVTSWVRVESDATVQGFSVPQGYAQMENWAIAAPRGSPFVAAWIDEYRHALRMGWRVFMSLPSTLSALKMPLENYRGGYLLQHACWAVVRSRPLYANAKIRMLPSVSNDGPFWLQDRCGWDGTCFAKKLFELPRTAFTNTSFVKMRGAERKFVKVLTEYRATNSWLAKELLGAPRMNIWCTASARTKWCVPRNYWWNPQYYLQDDTIETSLVLCNDAFVLLALFLGVLHAMRRRRPTRHEPIVVSWAIIIPVYLPNERKVIAETLKNMMRQNCAHIIVVFNIDSTADGDEIVAEKEIYALARDTPGARVDVVKHLSSGGKADNINLALHSLLLSDEEVVVVFDADHDPEIGCCEQLIRHLMANEQSGCVCAQGSVLIKRGNVLAHWLLWAIEWLGWNIASHMTTGLCGTAFFGGANAAWRVADLKRIGGFDGTALCEDIDLTLRMLNSGPRDDGVHPRIDFVYGANTLELPPLDFAAFLTQRLRWSMGWEQATFRHVDIA